MYFERKLNFKTQLLKSLIQFGGLNPKITILLMNQMYDQTKKLYEHKLKEFTFYQFSFAIRSAIIVFSKVTQRLYTIFYQGSSHLDEHQFCLLF